MYFVCLEILWCFLCGWISAQDFLGSMKYKKIPHSPTGFTHFVRDMVNQTIITYCRTTLTHSNGHEAFCGRLVIAN